MIASCDIIVILQTGLFHIFQGMIDVGRKIHVLLHKLLKQPILLVASLQIREKSDCSYKALQQRTSFMNRGIHLQLLLFSEINDFTCISQFHNHILQSMCLQHRPIIMRSVKCQNTNRTFACFHYQQTQMNDKLIFFSYPTSD